MPPRRALYPRRVSSPKVETVTPDPKAPTAGLDVRRRRLLFRCWHRGIREMDLLLGRFADERIAALSDAEVDALESLIEAPDPELFGWITGQRPVPANYDVQILQDIRDFHRDHPAAGVI